MGQSVSDGPSASDTPHQYATEDTPLEISHAASLSSLSMGDGEMDEASKIQEQSKLHSVSVLCGICVTCPADTLPTTSQPRSELKVLSSR